MRRCSLPGRNWGRWGGLVMQSLAANAEARKAASKPCEPVTFIHWWSWSKMSKEHGDEFLGMFASEDWLNLGSDTLMLDWRAWLSHKLGHYCIASPVVHTKHTRRVLRSPHYSLLMYWEDPSCSWVIDYEQPSVPVWTQVGVCHKSRQNWTTFDDSILVHMTCNWGHAMQAQRAASARLSQSRSCLTLILLAYWLQSDELLLHLKEIRQWYTAGVHRFCLDWNIVWLTGLTCLGIPVKCPRVRMWHASQKIMQWHV